MLLGVPFDKKIPLRLKGRVYHMVIRSVLLYVAECWPIKKSQVPRMGMAEMRMIHWMCGHMRFDRIGNGVIRSKTGVAPIEDKMREARLRWFGYIRRNMDAPVRRCKNFDRLHHKRSIGRPKKSWSQVITHDLKTLGVTEDMNQDRRPWRSRIKVVDVKIACFLFFLWIKRA